ncbi:MAG: riboflavin synthase [Candidatus Sumerlaeaceae bacterium]|nr:riboflavin synthase [Candidatus Sumerlaeaceae bacterium]
MFTGIIEEMGCIRQLVPLRDAVEISVACKQSLVGMKLGDSIAVDGICLTVTAFDSETFTALASAETLRRTSLGDKKIGDYVNLECPLTLAKKLSGHLVQGHVDGTAVVDGITPEGESQMWKFRLPQELAKYLVPKGSVAVDGISLTVVEAARDYFTVAIIPKTLAVTTLQFRRPGDKVNVEVDLIGKYVYRYLHPEEEAVQSE